MAVTPIRSTAFPMFKADIYMGLKLAEDKDTS